MKKLFDKDKIIKMDEVIEKLKELSVEMSLL